jgi:hypothetical protein
LKQVLGERVGSNRWKRSRAFGRNRANYGKLFVPDRERFDAAAERDSGAHLDDWPMSACGT